MRGTGVSVLRRSAYCAMVAHLMGAVPATAQTAVNAPRLVVVIAVDQLRADYLDRFAAYFGEGGFKRFMREGARFGQARYLHGTTKTCAGHATIMTGSSPSMHGVIANEWWDIATDREEYCARDDGAPLIGVDLEGRSPENLIGSTVGDVLKLSNGGRSRVLTVSGKDRSAIMLGGHSADAAYWMEDTLFVTSRYYRDSLPAWVERINSSGAITSYFGSTWERILAVDAYAVQGADDVPWERDKGGMGRAFPHVLGTTESWPGPDYVEALEYSPFQNEIVMDFAMEAIVGEGLGADAVPDILGIGLSANDRVGHAFGPDSHEILDMMVRTDHLLARFLIFLDQQVGMDNVVIVLTSDHGVAPIPEYVQEHHPGLSAIRLSPGLIAQTAEAALLMLYGRSQAGAWVRYQNGPYVYLNEAGVAARGITLEDAETAVAAAIEAVPGVLVAYTRTDLVRRRAVGDASPAGLSFHPARSGHVMYVTDPYVVEESAPDGTTHGTPWSYDRAVPLMFLGGGIPGGAHHREVSVVDIAPTLSVLLGIDRPAAATGRVLTEILR